VIEELPAANRRKAVSIFNNEAFQLWNSLSELVATSRSSGAFESCDRVLSDVAHSRSPIAHVLPIWLSDNLRMQGRLADAQDVLRRALHTGQDRRLFSLPIRHHIEFALLQLALRNAPEGAVLEHLREVLRDLPDEEERCRLIVVVASHFERRLEPVPARRLYSSAISGGSGSTDLDIASRSRLAALDRSGGAPWARKRWQDLAQDLSSAVASAGNGRLASLLNPVGVKVSVGGGSVPFLRSDEVSAKLDRLLLRAPGLLRPAGFEHHAGKFVDVVFVSRHARHRSLTFRLLNRIEGWVCEALVFRVLRHKG